MLDKIEVRVFPSISVFYLNKNSVHAMPNNLFIHFYGG